MHSGILVPTLPWRHTSVAQRLSSPMQPGSHLGRSTLFCDQKRAGDGHTSAPPQACEVSLTECMETRSTCYAEQRLLPVHGQNFKREAVRALLVADSNAHTQTCESVCAGQFGMGVRPLFHVKQYLMRHDIPLPRCSKWHEPRLRRSVRAACVQVHEAQMQQAMCPSCAREGGAPRPRCKCVKLVVGVIIAPEQYLRKNIAPPRSARPN